MMVATFDGREAAQHNERHVFHHSLRAESREVRAALTQMQSQLTERIDADALGRLELVLAEVMNNVAEHGRTQSGSDRPPFIHLCIVPLEDSLACAICDNGDDIPENCLAPRSLPPSDHLGLPEGGFGWFLIQDLTSTLIHHRNGRRNFLAFEIPYDPTNAARDPNAFLTALNCAHSEMML